MSDPNPPRRSQPPLMDGLGKLCTEGKELADYLWQVPKDEPARHKIVAILDQIAAEAAKQGRKEMPRICEELKTAAKATPSPQHVDELALGRARLAPPGQGANSRAVAAHPPRGPLPPPP